MKREGVIGMQVIMHDTGGGHKTGVACCAPQPQIRIVTTGAPRVR